MLSKTISDPFLIRHALNFFYREHFCTGKKKHLKNLTNICNGPNFTSIYDVMCYLNLEYEITISTIQHVFDPALFNTFYVDTFCIENTVSQEFLKLKTPGTFLITPVSFIWDQDKRPRFGGALAPEKFERVLT